MVQASKKLKNLLIFTLKLSLSAGLLYFLISKIGGDTIIGYIILINPFAFVFASGLYIFSIFLSSLRWSLLINQKVSKKRLFSMYMIGSFFNTCLPGIIGGDAIKSYYLSRELKNLSIRNNCCENNQINLDSSQGTLISIASVFMDRYIGFYSLMIIGMIAFPFGLRYLGRNSDNTALIWLLPVLFLFFTLASFIIFRFRPGEQFRWVLRLYEYFDLYKTRSNPVIKAFLYSLIIQVTVIFSVYVLSKGMSIEIPFLSLLIFMPMIVVISLIPVSISGLGLREFAFVLFLNSTGIPSDVSIALSLCWFFSVVAANILGFILYLLYKKEHGSQKNV